LTTSLRKWIERNVIEKEHEMKNSHPDPRQPRVAVIGIGTMGHAMAGRLLGAGLLVNVWSRHPTSTREFIELGATAYADAREAVANAEVVVTMLATFDAIKEVMFEAKTLDAMAPNSTWVQMATIGVSATHQLAIKTTVLRSDVAFVDAPVSGSREPAESGQLLILASGPEKTRELLEPLFGALGKRTMWLGSAGAGSAMKLVLNTWLAFQTEGAAESAALADILGVVPTQLREALSDSPLASNYALTKLQRMLDEDFHADFALDWALKDLDLVASDSDTRATPVAGAIAKRWRNLVKSGSSGLDVSAARRGLGSARPSTKTPAHHEAVEITSTSRP
jgi:3-hydroxyisobutyrate dehydrogenase